MTLPGCAAGRFDSHYTAPPAWAKLFRAVLGSGRPSWGPGGRFDTARERSEPPLRSAESPAAQTDCQKMHRGEWPGGGTRVMTVPAPQPPAGVLRPARSAESAIDNPQ